MSYSGNEKNIFSKKIYFDFNVPYKLLYLLWEQERWGIWNAHSDFTNGSKSYGYKTSILGEKNQ